MTTEYALRYRYDNGSEIIGQPSSLPFCRMVVQTHRSDKADWHPRAVAVMRRDVGEWEELDESSRDE